MLVGILKSRENLIHPYTLLPIDSVIRIHDATTPKYTKINQLIAKDVNWCILDVAYSPDSEYIVYSTWSSCRKLLLC